MFGLIKALRRSAIPLACALLAACTSTVQYQGSGYQGDLYTIREGESLYAIAWRYGLDYKQVAAWNNIGPPYTIYPGQRIRLNPPPGLVSATMPRPIPAPNPPVRSTPAPAAVPLPPARPITPQPIPPSPTTVATAPQGVSAKGWQWPAQGEVIRTFSPYSDGKKGIDIAGTLGQPIYAASGGQVVYSGNGLVGYGELIIIKHDDDFLSAYAHNQKLLVREGEQVRAGQTIAQLGSTGASRPMLHFEIRRDGEPVDPLQYLPGR
jgi:lipoprotein NlpD